MRKKKLILIVCIFSFYTFNSCTKEKTFDCVKSTGDIKKEDRYFDDFSIIEVEDNINVILVQDLTGKIIVEAGENLLPKIKCNQDGNKIRIQNKNTCNWVRSYKHAMNVYIGINQAKKIIQKGYGKISNGEYIKTDTLRLNCVSYGEVDLTIDSKFIGFLADDHTTLRLSGKSNSIAGSCFNNSSTNTEKMYVKWFVMSNQSLLDANIYCDSLLQAKIGGSGNINCAGHPPIVEYEQLSGSGKLQFP